MLQARGLGTFHVWVSGQEGRVPTGGGEGWGWRSQQEPDQAGPGDQGKVLSLPPLKGFEQGSDSDESGRAPPVCDLVRKPRLCSSTFQEPTVCQKPLGCAFPKVSRGPIT